MNTEQLCIALGVLAELSDKAYNLSATEQSDQWKDLRSAIHWIHNEIEKQARVEVMA